MTDPLLSVAVPIAAAAGLVAGGARWLRVAQREHYLSGAVVRFARRWWLSNATNVALFTTALIGALGVWWWPPLGLLSLALVAGPRGLRVRGTSSPLRWTARLKRLAAITSLLALGGVATSLVTGEPGWSVLVALSIPLLVDLALAVLTPIERSLGEGWVTRAAAKLAASGARVVAITGSYGKTTTKGYVQHLLAGRISTVATPASFNNRLGLARAINEHLTPGTDVFVAEMGTYRKGEIAELCEFVRPEVAAITSIGPVHLERFGTEEAIVAAKREILTNAPFAIVSVDHPLLAEVADQEDALRTVIRVSASGADAPFTVVDGVLWIEGQAVGRVEPDVFGANLAVAAAIASHFGIPAEEIGRRLDSLPVAVHRRQQSTSPSGVVIIDDTYNSNPAGASAALDLLCALPAGGRRVVVTPGMVELGERQFDENSRFARSVSARTSDLVIVGGTNRRALEHGAAGGAATVTVLPTRQEAVEWVRSHLRPGDAVLYENDLPDHYP